MNDYNKKNWEKKQSTINERIMVCYTFVLFFNEY